jgi:hypothetical protein
LWHAINYVGDEMKTVQVVHHHHVERSRGRAYLLVTAHVEVLVVGAAVREPMKQPGSLRTDARSTSPSPGRRARRDRRP